MEDTAFGSFQRDKPSYQRYNMPQWWIFSTFINRSSIFFIIHLFFLQCWPVSTINKTCHHAKAKYIVYLICPPFHDWFYRLSTFLLVLILLFFQIWPNEDNCYKTSRSGWFMFSFVLLLKGCTLITIVYCFISLLYSFLDSTNMHVRPKIWVS